MSTCEHIDCAYVSVLTVVYHAVTVIAFNGYREHHGCMLSSSECLDLCLTICLLTVLQPRLYSLFCSCTVNRRHVN